MQTKDKLYPFDDKKYAYDLSLYPSSVKSYKNPPQPDSSISSIKFNLCSKQTSDKLNSDPHCVCYDKKKVVKIIEGQSYYFCN
jgi:hypothetical protein